MSYAVLRVAPVKLSALGSMSKHHAREHSVTDAHIDPARSTANRTLIGSGDPAADVHAVVQQVPMAMRQGDPTVAAEIILTAGRKYFDQQFPSWRSDPDTLKPWIDANLKFLQSSPDTTGKTVSAVLHLDEDAPHLHVVTVPIAPVRFKNKHQDKTEDRISYTKIFGDNQATLAEARRTGTVLETTKLGRLQTAYAEAVNHLGLERGLSNTGRKHVAPKDHRAALAVQQVPTITHLSDVAQQPKPIKGLDRLTAAKDILAHGEDAEVIKQHRDAEAALSREIAHRGKLLPTIEKMEAAEREIRILKNQNETLEKQVRHLSKVQQSQAEELRQNKELLKEYRGLTEYDLMRANVAQSEEITDFNRRSGRSKFNAIDFIKDKYNCDMPTAIYTLAETFKPDQVALTAAEKKAYEAVPEAFKKADEHAQTVAKTLGEINSDLSKTITPKTKTPAITAKESIVDKQLHAIDAGLYRITLMSSDPKNPTFNLGKGKGENGNEKFFTAQEVTELIPTLSYRNAHGYNVFITPMPSEEKRFILLDDIRDMDKAKAFTPALILQTSPKSRQALYIVDGSLTHEAANTTFRSLNKLYGDEKITGLVHPMRLAGFTNRKPKHEEHGQYPFVSIVDATGAHSPKLAEYAHKLEESFGPSPDASPMPDVLKDRERVQARKVQPWAMKAEVDKAGLKKWYQHQVEYWADRADLSKIDRRLATALAEAGVSEGSTKDLIREISPDLTTRHPDTERYLRDKVSKLEFKHSEKTNSNDHGMEP